MEDRLFHFIEIGVQILGLALLVFKGGKYIGTANGSFKTLFNGQEELKKIQSEHQADDNEKHEKIVNAISDVRVEVGKLVGAREKS